MVDRHNTMVLFYVNQNKTMVKLEGTMVSTKIPWFERGGADNHGNEMNTMVYDL